MTPLWLHWKRDPAPYSAVAGFVATRIGAAPIPDGTALAVTDDGDLVAAVIYHNFMPDAGTIEISAASDTKRWMTRPVLWEMFDFPFNDLGCQAVVARTSPQDAPLQRIQKAYGFVSYTIPRLRGRDRDEVVSILTDDAWRANGFHKEHRHG